MRVKIRFFFFLKIDLLFWRELNSLYRNFELERSQVRFSCEVFVEKGFHCSSTRIKHRNNKEWIIDEILYRDLITKLQICLKLSVSMRRNRFRNYKLGWRTWIRLWLKSCMFDLNQFYRYLILDSIFNGASSEIYINIMWKLFIFRRLNISRYRHLLLRIVYWTCQFNWWSF